MTILTSARFPVEMLDALRVAAEADQRTVNGLLRKIVADWLAQHAPEPRAN